MQGLIGAGQGYRRMADAALGQAAELETVRQNDNRMAKAARKQSQIGGAASGAATGAYIGSAFPGWGTAIGAGVGGIIGYFGGSI